MPEKTPGKYHLLGIGGIGMSAIARLLKQEGHIVSGEDKKDSELLKVLEKEGIKQERNRCFCSKTQVIYSSAIREDHPQILQAKKKKLPLLHRSAILQQYVKEKTSLLVAGTHGKTTTSSLITHVLLQLKQDPSFALGGILKGKNTNAYLGKGSYFVAEADESDGSFLTLKKDYAIVTNIEEDHLEYWETRKNLHKGFFTFCQSTRLIYCRDDPVLSSFSLKGISYGFCKQADYSSEDIVSTNKGMLFTIRSPIGIFTNVFIPLFGEHNVHNALAVFALTTHLGFNPFEIISAFKNFQGVQRRMDVHLDRKDLLLIDDYAHHPTEIQATCSALKKRVSARRLIAVFQPYRSERLRGLFMQFAQCFSHADEIIITDIYEVGKPVSLDIEDLVAKMGKKKCRFVKKNELIPFLQDFIRPFDVVVTLGAGDIFTVLAPLKKVQKTCKVALLFGGPSYEHDVSILSSQFFLQGLQQKHFQVMPVYIKEHMDKLDFVKKLLSCDVCIPCLHGSLGEDGTIQGFLKTLQIPFTSSDVLSCALSMNKALAKKVVQAENIFTARFIEIKKDHVSQEKILDQLKDFSFPVYIKPCSSGSSFGVYQVQKKTDLFYFMEKSFLFDDHLIIEEKIYGEEIEVGIIGNQEMEEGLLARIPTKGKKHTYETKYGKNALPIEIPAKISKSTKEEVIFLAKKIYQVFCCSCFARIDFFVTNTHIYFNEINPIPGMTATSAFPLMFARKGKKIEDLVNDLIILALGKSK